MNTGRKCKVINIFMLLWEIDLQVVSLRCGMVQFCGSQAYDSLPVSNVARKVKEGCVLLMADA